MAMGWPGLASVAAIGLALLGSPANADPVPPAYLVPALDVYVDAIAGDHVAALACAKPDARSRDDGEWTAARLIFIATLWANDFPADFIEAAAARFEAAAPAVKPDCTDHDTLERIRDPDHEGWAAYLAHGLAGMELKPVFPVTEDRWQAIKDVIARELPQQKHIFACLAAAQPEFLPLAVHDWDRMLDGITEKLNAAGLPRDEVTATLAPAEANALWQRAAAGDIPALKADCAKDLTWSDRFFGLKYLSLAGTVDQLLPVVPSAN
jgi:hypothetical protein